MDVDTRLLRYFAVVAQEGHLTRAAQRLFVSQPALTKQVKQLEALIGVTLFARSRNGMALTEAGQELMGTVPALLADWDSAVRRTRSAASRAAKVLRVGFIASAANEATQDIVAEFARRYPDWRVRLRQADWAQPSAGLAAGEVDAAMLRLPFPGQENFAVRVLFSEPRCVALSSHHPLATVETVAFADLLDEPFVAAPEHTGPLRDYWLATEERGGRAARIGAVTVHPDEWLSAIANGDGIALAPDSAARFYQRPGVVYRPLTGVSPSQVAVAFRASESSEADGVLRDFVECCVERTRAISRP